MLINGWGTSTDGNVPTEKGYITTEFFYIFWIPIFPVRSYEVIDDRMYSLKKLHRPSYFSIMFTVWGTVCLWILIGVGITLLSD